MAQSLDDPPVRFPLAELPLSGDEVERARLVDFEVERDSELPLATQLGWKLRGMMVRGVLRPGDRLPSVRELASFAAVNVNTARAVYRELEREGLISSEPGRGTFVDDAAVELRELEQAAAEAAEEARARGFDPKTLAAALYSDPRGREPRAFAPEPFPEIDPELGAGDARSALREQIGRLEREIADYAWHDPSPAPRQRPRGGEPVGRVISVEELERTRAELIDRLRRLRGEAAKRGAKADAAQAHVEAMLRDPSAHRWEMVRGEATEEGDCKSWHVVPAWGPVGAIMGWWRVKVSSGCPSAVPLAAVERVS